MFPNTVSSAFGAIASGTFPDGTKTQSAGRNGPTVVGSSLYLTGGDVNTVLGLAQVYKSTDAGVTWSLMDGANGPGIFANFVQSVLDNDGVRIWVVFLDQNIFLSIAIFDTSTDTWGPVLGTPTSVNITGGVWISAEQDQAGNILVGGPFGATEFITPFDTATAQFIVFTGGDWELFFRDFTQPPDIAGAPHALSLSLMIRAGGFIHCFFNQVNDSAPSVPCFHQSIASGTFHLGTLEQLPGGATAVPSDLVATDIPVPFAAVVAGGVVFVAASGIGAPAQDFTQLFLGSAANGADLGISLTPRDLFVGGAQVQSFGLVSISGVVYAFFAWAVTPPPGIGTSSFSYLAVSPSGSASVLIGALADNGVLYVQVSAFSGSYALAFWNVFSGTEFFWSAVPTPPPAGPALVEESESYYWWFGPGAVGPPELLTVVFPQIEE
jgi:hypothetical protein